MRRALCWLLMSCVILGTGCSRRIDPGPTNPEPVEITGKLTRAGKPVSGVTIFFQTTGQGGTQAAMPVKNGEFKGVIMPGTYTYSIQEGDDPKAFEAIPKQYYQGDLNRTVEVSAGARLEIKLDG